MSVATQIAALQADKTAIRNAILAKGGTSPSGNGFDDFANDIATISGGGGSGKAAQASDSMERVSSTTMSGSAVSLTVAKTGTYTVRWYGYRSSTTGTNGSQLYIDGTAYDTMQSNFSVNSNGQTVKLTGVHLTQGQVITVKARARGTGYYMWIMGLSILEE